MLSWYYFFFFFFFSSRRRHTRYIGDWSSDVCSSDLDPGKDPNPADIAIQMHLLLLLSKVRPAEAHALCESLRPLINDDRIWVYYSRTPLIPMLRISDLRRAGCALELPESRMRTDVP